MNKEEEEVGIIQKDVPDEEEIGHKNTEFKINESQSKGGECGRSHRQIKRLKCAARKARLEFKCAARRASGNALEAILPSE